MTPTNVILPYVTVDQVRYNDKPLWPAAADGSGASLQRRAAAAYGNDPANWEAAAPTPGAPSITADTDGDGLPDVWEAANGTDPLAPDAGADPDHDGMTTWHEYLAGTSPTNALSVLKIEDITAGTDTTLTFNAVSNRTYTVQYTDNLGSTWLKLADVLSSPTNRAEIITDAPPASSRFYRIATPQQP